MEARALNDGLMAVFDCADDDLAANRAGRVSCRQKWALLRPNFDATLFALVLLGLLVVGLAFVASLETAASPDMFVAVLGVVGTVLMFPLSLRWTATLLSIAGGVAVARGALALRVVDKDGAPGYECAVGDAVFDVPASLFKTLKSMGLAQRRCQAYYLPRMHALLSLEAVRDAEAHPG